MSPRNSTIHYRRYLGEIRARRDQHWPADCIDLCDGHFTTERWPSVEYTPQVAKHPSYSALEWVRLVRLLDNPASKPIRTAVRPHSMYTWNPDAIVRERFQSCFMPA